MPNYLNAMSSTSYHVSFHNWFMHEVWISSKTAKRPFWCRIWHLS